METKIEVTCRVCDSHEAADWLYPREMMFGLREEFPYFRCAACGCLQILKVPVNLSGYYPDNYYSLQPPPERPFSWNLTIREKVFYPSMTMHKLGWGSAAGRFFCRYGAGPPVPTWLRHLVRPIPFNGGVLDVGCGSGINLLALRNCGFTNLLGVDPFIKESINYRGVRVVKCHLQDVQREFSIVYLGHVLEHLENPLETLRLARELLSTGGQIVISLPLSDSVAAQTYKENWVQLDAPRHVTLHTRKSMEVLAEKSELKIARVVYDSAELQFWGSEQYLRDIPLHDARSYLFNPKEVIFTNEIIKGFCDQAEQLNREQKGDQASFVFVR